MGIRKRFPYFIYSNQVDKVLQVKRSNPSKVDLETQDWNDGAGEFVITHHYSNSSTWRFEFGGQNVCLSADSSNNVKPEDDAGLTNPTAYSYWNVETPDGDPIDDDDDDDDEVLVRLRNAKSDRYLEATSSGDLVLKNNPHQAGIWRLRRVPTGTEIRRLRNKEKQLEDIKDWLRFEDDLFAKAAATVRDPAWRLPPAPWFDELQQDFHTFIRNGFKYPPGYVKSNNWQSLNKNYVP